MPDAIVISGGAARGAAFLGALHRLQEMDVLTEVKVLVGTSIGALAAALLCQRVDMQIAMAKIAANPFELDLDLVSLEPPFGIDTGLQLLKFIRHLIGCWTFSQMKAATDNKLVVCATSVTDKQPVYFSVDSHPEMEVAKAVRLSCGLPLVFAYDSWGDKVFVDGGLTDNFPVAPARAAGCQRILGLRLKQPDTRQAPEDLVDYVMTLMSCVAWQAECKDDGCWKVIEIDAEQQGVLDFSMTDETLKRLFLVGYKAVRF